MTVQELISDAREFRYGSDPTGCLVVCQFLNANLRLLCVTDDASTAEDVMARRSMAKGVLVIGTIDIDQALTITRSNAPPALTREHVGPPRLDVRLMV